MGSSLYSRIIFIVLRALASQSPGGTHQKSFLELSCARVQSGFVHFILTKETCGIPLKNKVSSLTMLDVLFSMSGCSCGAQQLSPRHSGTKL